MTYCISPDQFTTAGDRAPTVCGLGHSPLDEDAKHDQVLALLNDALANAIVCVLRYRQHYFLARGARSHAVAWDFLDHSNDQQGHADLIAEHILQMGGQPDFSPEKLIHHWRAARADDSTVANILRSNLTAANLVMGDYRRYIVYLRDAYPSTRRVLESIIEDEQAHVAELSHLMQAAPAYDG